MRCPKCGSENAPDSRFCGVCGLPQPAPSRLAPTTKIPDDAPFAPPTRQVAPISPVAGVSYHPPSMPPQHAGGLAPQPQAGLVTRPGGHAAPPRTGDQAQVRPSGDHQQVRPSGDYQQVRPSGLAPGRQSFDSITPTARQERTPIPGTPQRPSGPRASQGASNPSMSFSAAPPRPLGLIAIVFIIDLGLAGSGAFLLAKGLSSPKPEKADTATDKKSELPGAAPAAAMAPKPPAETAVVAAMPSAVTAVPVASAPATGSAIASAAPAAETTAAARTTKTRGATATTTTPASGPVTSPTGNTPTATPVTSVPTTPVQPLQPPSTASQIDTLANQSAMAFERCRGDQPVAGAITIAFNVQPDGTVANNNAVENTTGNPELGACLARVVGGWRVSAFQGNTMSFVRPFNYP